jgi:hypothetical protein
MSDRVEGSTEVFVLEVFEHRHVRGVQNDVLLQGAPSNDRRGKCDADRVGDRGGELLRCFVASIEIRQRRVNADCHGSSADGH